VSSTERLVWAMTSTASSRILKLFSKPIKAFSHPSFIGSIKCTLVLPFSYVENLRVEEPAFSLVALLVDEPTRSKELIMLLLTLLKFYPTF
jgi:hypothetical protein